MKFNEEYISLLAGLVDEDHIEETRHRVHDVLQEIDEKEVKYVSDTVTLLEEHIAFREEPYEGVSDLDREKATAANAQPKSVLNGDDEEPIPNTGDWKYYTPDHTVRKCIDHESGEYKKKTPLPAVQKWKSNTLEFEGKQNNFLDKYSLEECGMEPEMGGEGEMGYMGDMLDDLENPQMPQAAPSMEIMATASIPIPASTLVTLTTVQDPGPATNIVLTIGADGVPMSYIHKALEELAMDPSSVAAHNELAELVGKPPVGEQSQDVGDLDPIMSWSVQDHDHSHE